MGLLLRSIPLTCSPPVVIEEDDVVKSAGIAKPAEVANTGVASAGVAKTAAGVAKAAAGVANTGVASAGDAKAAAGVAKSAGAASAGDAKAAAGVAKSAGAASAGDAKAAAGVAKSAGAASAGDAKAVVTTVDVLKFRTASSGVAKVARAASVGVAKSAGVASANVANIGVAKSAGVASVDVANIGVAKAVVAVAGLTDAGVVETVGSKPVGAQVVSAKPVSRKAAGPKTTNRVHKIDDGACADDGDRFSKTQRKLLGADGVDDDEPEVALACGGARAAATPCADLEEDEVDYDDAAVEEAGVALDRELYGIGEEADDQHVDQQFLDRIAEKAAAWCQEGAMGKAARPRVNARITISTLCEIARRRGGKCLTVEYLGFQVPIEWECSEGHQWQATINNVKNHGSWCPHCRINVGEEISRAAFEGSLGVPFHRTRREPWLNGLELDGYDPSNRVAFEYQGRQHYMRVAHFQRTDAAFESQLRRDRETAARCLANGVRLIIIPYTVQMLNIRAFVRAKLAELNLTLAAAEGTENEFFDTVRASGPHARKQFAKFEKVVHDKGGVCLSKKYLGNRVPMRVLCGKKHEFEATLEGIDQPESRGPRFCPVCGGTKPKTKQEHKEQAESCGYTYRGSGSRVSEDGKRTRTTILVTCPFGHNTEPTWENFKPTNGKPKRGCVHCYNLRRGKNRRLNIVAAQRKLKIKIQETYVCNSEKYKWKCDARGHIFCSTWTSFSEKLGACTQCSMIDYAEAHELDHLSPWPAELSPMEMHLWSCRRCKHQFSASWGVLGRGQFKQQPCPHCE